MIRANIEQVIAVARSQIGYTERPTNRTKYGQWYGMDGVAWCAIFVSWAFAHGGSQLPRMGGSKGFAYCPDVENYARSTGTWKTSGAKRGDLILFSFGGKRADHVGIVQGVGGDGRILTVEGNTNAAGSRTGGQVAEQWRRSKIRGFVTVGNTAAAAKPPPVDWAAIRRVAAGAVYNTLTKCPNVNPREQSLYVSTYKAALNLVGNAKLNEKDMTYDLPMVAAVTNFQRWMKGLGAPVNDKEGYAHESTRFYLCVALANIRDGKA